MSRRALGLLTAAALAVTGVAGLVPQVATAAPSTLVADAGASSAVNAGEHAIVLASGYGGAAPYTFEWSTEAGTVESTSNAATGIDTSGLAGGQYTATVRVTDSAGATATDTVEFLVASAATDDEDTPADGGEQVTLLDETVDDPSPGAGETFTFPFDVPVGMSRIVVDLTWDNVVNDYDLAVNDPDGNEGDTSGNFATYEHAEVGAPVAGTWEAVVDEYASSGSESLRVVVVATKSADQALEESGNAPLPSADANGTYEFTLDEAITLAGSVTGGEAPLTTGWDLDLDGVVDAAGTEITADLPRGHHLVRFLATDARGFEAQQMTSVIVGTEDEIADLQVPVTLIAMSDSGINPYHEEFSAATYPDPEILRLTQNFTRHPSEYIPGYPANAMAAPITPGTYYPEQDQWIFRREVVAEATPQCAGDLLLESEMTEAHVKEGTLYWFPGTKIVGGISDGGYSADDCPDRDLILDNNGHGSGSASVSTGNRYGYCPTCLIMMVEGLNEDLVFSTFPFAEITSHSHGYVGGLPIGYEAKAFEMLGDARVGASSLAAVERGQTVMFAAGNGVGNAFDVPQRTYDSDQTGPAWNLVVGALRRDDQGAVTGDGIPQYISSWGDGNLPSACRTGVHGQCAFGGTSAATPYSAGTLGTILQEVKDAIGDGHLGLHPNQVVAKGRAIPGSPWLEDGELTRNELRAVFLKTAEYLNVTSDPGQYPFPDSYNGEQMRYAHEGYGMAGPNHATRAIAVLLGQRELPDRAEEDDFFAQDCELRQALYGGYDMDGDGEQDDCSKDPSVLYPGTGERTSEPHDPNLFDAARGEIDADVVLTEPIAYFLHRQYRTEPYREAAECGLPQTATEDDMEQFMDRENSPGDVDPCFDSRITSTVAAFRPKGIYTSTDTIEGTLATGSEVDIRVYVQTAGAGPLQMTGRLMATDRVLGESDEVTSVTNFGSWTQVRIQFTTDRPAFRGEHLTVQFTLAGQTEWAYGHEGDQASSVFILPAPAPDGGDEFGVTIDDVAPLATGADALSLRGTVAFPDLGPDTDLHNAGFHPVQYNVEVSVDDDTFARPVYAVVDSATSTWQATIPGLGDGEHTVHVRALRDRTPSAVATTTVGHAASGTAPAPAPVPLPTTGGGVALAAMALVGLSGALRRRRT